MTNFRSGSQEVWLYRDTIHPGLQVRRKSTITFINLEIHHNALDVTGTRYPNVNQLYTVPFQFVVPELVPVGLAQTWSQTEALKEWHALLPPSFSPGVHSRGGIFNLRPDESGKVQYAISVSIFGTLGQQNSYCIGSSRREIRLRPRPWQINLLDNAPFLQTKPSRRQIFPGNFFRRSLETMSLETARPDLGHHSIGHLVQDQISFGGTLSAKCRLKRDDTNMQVPRLLSVTGKVHEFTTYRAEAMSEARPLEGHRVCRKAELTVARTHVTHWEPEPAPETLTVNEDQPGTTFGNDIAADLTQGVTIDWKWSTGADFTPSFSTALISHWFEICLEMKYENPGPAGGSSLRCNFPIKLSVEPSLLSIDDGPLEQIPRYLALTPIAGEGELDQDSLEGLPSYESSI